MSPGAARPLSPEDPSHTLETREKTLRREERRALLEDARREGGATATQGPDAARSQDFLYDDNGIPG